MLPTVRDVTHSQGCYPQMGQPRHPCPPSASCCPPHSRQLPVILYLSNTLILWPAPWMKNLIPPDQLAKQDCSRQGGRSVRQASDCRHPWSQNKSPTHHFKASLTSKSRTLSNTVAVSCEKLKLRAREPQEENTKTSQESQPLVYFCQECSLNEYLPAKELGPYVIPAGSGRYKWSRRREMNAKTCRVYAESRAS